MKLRIKGNSLRLRLTRGEVDHLASTGSVRESMHLSGASFSYELRSDPAAQQMLADMAGASLTVILPASMMQSWANTEQVSLLGQDGPLQILVEKDFACLQPRQGEDDSDAFPHPDQTDDAQKDQN